MKILITGAKGFIGKHLVMALRHIMEKKDKLHQVKIDEIYAYDIDTDPSLLDTYCKQCDFVFHLAGVNRPKEESEFMEGNFGFTSILLNKLKQYENKAPIMISSSIQAILDNPYGRSKKSGEELIQAYGTTVGVKTFIYRFPNVFGMWCKPNYNSVVATFCHNIANSLPITIHQEETILKLVYVGDIIEELLACLQGNANQKDAFCYVKPTYEITLGQLANLLFAFKESRRLEGVNKISIPDVENELVKKLYATYTSYIPKDDFSYDLKMNQDQRGSFTEIIRTSHHGQFSVNISEPGITKGFHYHTYTKVEKFVVVSGQALIRFRKPNSDEIIEYVVDGNHIKVVDIPLGYTHEITNLSSTEKLVTFMWCDECFDPEKPDTYFLEVDKKNE